MITPACPLHGEMELVEISQGETLLGWIWFCREKECQECADYDPLLHGEQIPKYSSPSAESASPVAVTPDPQPAEKKKKMPAQLSFLD